MGKSIREQVRRTLEEIRDTIQTAAEMWNRKPVPVRVPVRVDNR